ncbi:nitronate monooxygenase [Enterocloster citroniae]|uniref:Probable nitronate monooxygenase n=1 Tax=Enterocloster citroniae TaxID=358743 RepID=A0AA41FGQ9_9FIRM|nr:nitronate monooxygenase [Enterocloster citroniae]MCC3384728.1 nitronate monooxygenase [Enterocloster citroniae]RGC08409.1 nitronate monooxygenase [Enterocloster citroniae]
MKTKFTEMFGIEKPIVQGGMQHLGIADFASLVSNAGGMGTMNITCYPGIDEFREDIIKMKELTDKPFIVNISLVPDLTKGEEIFQYIDVCAREQVAAIEFAGASPVEFMPACKEAGIRIIHKSPNAKVAASMARKGADVITIAGYEVAGHPSLDGIGTFVIANKAAAVCGEYGVPVLAAGGVADGKGLAAALALGAQGVVMGTRFVATKECPISDNHKQWLLEHTEKDTVLVQKSIHNAARVANNLAAKLTLEMEARGTTLQELMTVISGKLSRQCYKNGNIDGGIYALGPAMGLIRDIKTVQELMDGMVDEAEAVINGLRSGIC